MVENYRSEQKVEFSILKRWWVELIVAAIFPICLSIGYFTTPDFKFEGIMLIFTFFAIIEVLVMVVSLLRRKVTKRFTVDSSTRSLVFEEFWSILRISKKTFPFDIINKFDLVFRNMRKGRYSMQQVTILTLTFQSGKVKYLTGILDQDNIETWADQLNKLLKEHGGFPSERFAEPLTPHWLDRN